MDSIKDELEIDNISARFFDLFTNINNQSPKIRGIKEFFIPKGIIINNTETPPAIYDLESFIKPREEILTNGTLVNFREREVFHKTEIHGSIAHRTCHYEKSGILNGEPYSGGGIKMFQFIKIKDQWFLSSVVWKDQK